MSTHINYIEMYTNDMDRTKKFYNQCFQWQFTDYGPTYSSFENSGLAGGFELTDKQVVNGALVVLYHNDLEVIYKDVKNAGGSISKEIFSFPGGRRFHFMDPVGNELAIWSEDNS